MNMAWLKPLITKTRRTLIRNSPHILMGLGATSGVTAVIFAVKATPGAMQAKKDAEFEKSAGKLPESGGVRGVFKDDIVRLTPMETLKACWKYYIPAAGMEVFSLMCFFGAHGISVRRQAILASVASTAETALQEYQRKVVDMIGDKGEREIRKSIAQDHVNANPPPTNTMFLPGDLECWCLYDDQKFRGSYLSIKNAQNDANEEMIQNMYLSKTELMWFLDPERKYLKPSSEDGQIGWNLDRLIRLHVEPAIGENNLPVLVVTVEDKNGAIYPPKPEFGMMH